MSENPKSPAFEPGSFMTRGFKRLSLSCFAAMLAVIPVAWFEWVQLEGVQLQGWVAIFGVLAPLGLAVGVLCAVASLVLQPGRDIGILGLYRLRELSGAGRRLGGTLACVAPVGMVVWLVATARAALELFASQLSAATSAVALASVSALLLLLLLGAVIAVARWLAPKLPQTVDPVRYWLVASVLLVALFGLLVWVGNTSGAGSSWQVFGTLRRVELDLRAPLYLLLIGLAGYQLPAFLSRVPAPAALGVALLGMAPLLPAASWFSDAELRLGTQRSTALAKSCLQLLQSWSDGDADGFGAHFGGGDCNDENASINPNADDIPANGIDEDCSGSDAKPRKPNEPQQQPEQDVSPEKLPEKLNVLLITIDTLRWDLGYMGYERPITPNIDELAKRGVVFEKAYALASYTSKSMGPMLIGRYGSETKRGWRHFNKYKQDTMLQERLQEAGIHTVSVQGHWYFTPEYGLGRGFDVLDMSAAPDTPQKRG